MAQPLNLTLKRGPSVWDGPQTAWSDWRRYGLLAGAMLASAAWQRRSGRAWILGLATGIMGTCLLAGRFTETVEAGTRQLHRLRGTHKDHVVDRASEDSFPASDAPQY